METRINLFIAFITLLIFLISPLSNSAWAQYPRIAQMLCEKAIRSYEQGDYTEAVREFKKVLLISPQEKEAEIAQKYLALIAEKLTPKEVKPAPVITAPVAKIEALPVKQVARLAEKPLSQEILLAQKLLLDEQLRLSQPQTKLEAEVNQAFVIEGREIARWLVTAPEYIAVERVDVDQIKVSAKQIGQSFVHIWDQGGRWTLNIKVIPPRYIERIIEAQRKEMEEVEPFKLRYSFNRASFHEGRKVYSTERKTLTFDQWIGLTGQTPYGYFDTMAQVSKLSESTDLTNFTIGLTDAQIGPVSDFDLRGFDYTASFSEIIFPGESLRGLRLDKDALGDDLTYTAFWGREGQGKFGRLSPGLAEVKDAFIAGGELNYFPSDSLHYRLSSLWGYGDQREDYLKNSVLGLGIDYRLKAGLTLGSEVAYDEDHFALLLDSNFVAPKLKLSTEFRDLEKDFLTITGRPSRAGDIGGRIIADYVPFNWFNLSGDLDIYRDRLFPNPDEPDRFNLNLNSTAHLALNPTTSARLNYQYIDEIGKLSPRQANYLNLGLSKRFPDLRNLSTHLGYKYRDSENPKTVTMDYAAHSLTAGLSLRLVGDLTYYASEEISWLTENYTDIESNPCLFETGLDYYSRLFNLPLYLTLRLNYRDEQDASSPYSFLSGEDSIECSSEIAYRPYPDFELFASSRLKNIWPDSLDAEGGTEMEIRAGGRMAWDTGKHWNSSCTVSGLVYKDLNDDGKRQDREPLVEGVKLVIGKKEQLTDSNGTYVFTNVSGKKAIVELDASSLPDGFLVRGSDAQEITIAQAKTVKVDFGIISRSEIFGIVFEDVDGDGRFGPEDSGIASVKLSLEDGAIAVTDSKGQYYFRHVTVGEHTITLEINSLPLEYLPTTALSNKITLFEGITYIHHFPLKRALKKSKNRQSSLITAIKK